jgi:hypothetical protein
VNALSRGTIPQDTGQPEDLKIVPEEPDTIRSIFRFTPPAQNGPIRMRTFRTRESSAEAGDPGEMASEAVLAACRVTRHRGPPRASY